MDREQVTRTLADFFARGADPFAAVYLFGSVARGTAGPASDIDVGVLFGRGTERDRFPEALRLESGIEALLGREVQVVALDRAPVDLVHRVLRDGFLVHEGDRSARIRFEVRARAEYFDLLPFLRRYRRLEPRPR